MSTASARSRAVLDTSFWAAAYRAEVAANCLDLFEIIVPRAVEAEIRVVQEDHPQREYPHATLFRHLRGQMLDPPEVSARPLPILGAGEAEAIPLAAQLDAFLLINERRGIRHAMNLGVAVFSVPALVVLLRARQVIGDRAARRKLELIEAITPRFILEEARVAIDTIAERRGDR